jgi:hypothetical protein
MIRQLAAFAGGVAAGLGAVWMYREIVATLDSIGCVPDDEPTIGAYNPVAEPQSVTTNRALQRVSNLGLL